MKKALKKQAALVMLSAVVAAQTGFPGYAATTVTGSWKNEDGSWKFYSPDQKTYTGWVKTESGWYYLNPADGKMATGWQRIDGHWYYFDTAAEGTEGKMHTGWYKTPENNWFFFNNGSGTAQEGYMVTGWQWIDGYCYYFSAEFSDQPGVQGAMYAGKTTPDGYPTNANGQWTQDGKAVNRPGVGFNTKTESTASNGSGSSSSSSSSGGSSSGGNNSSNTPSTPDTPTTPDTPNTPDTPSTPDVPGIPDTPENPDAPVEYQYLLMNIPYEDFYAEELTGNDVEVDAVTSATKSKPRSGSLVAGSYHVKSDGSDISGVTFPVKIKKGTDLSKFRQITDADSFEITVTNRGQVQTTKYEGKDALFESADYSYYVLSEVPSYYKEVSVDADGNFSFGKVQGSAKTVEGVSATLATTSSYGDYQLGFQGLPDISSDTVYGVILHTEEGEDYGLRHLENIWLRTQLAWSAGFTTQSHSSPLSYEHYQSMMGKHLSGVTYYTSEGILEIPFAENVYVPVKLSAGLTMENTATDAGENGIIVSGVTFPSDFEVAYQVKNALGETIDMQYDAASGKLTWEGGLAAGSYTLTVTDQSGKYAPVSGTFVLETEAVPAAFTLTEDGWKVTKAEDASDEEFKAYLAAITKVKVGETEYAASGRGAVKIIDAMTGEIDFTATSNNKAIFEIGKEYPLEITATGYKKNLTGTVTAAEKKPQTNAAEGEATVETTDGKYVDGTYQAKVLVTTDADGKIVSIKDNGTEPGANSTYWDNAKGMFVKLAGKTIDEIDGVDAVTRATVSSNAIKKAVKSALKKGEVSDEYQYLLMNIPYEEFYEAEVEGNEQPVDGVSSATKMKTRTGTLVGGSYHSESDGTKINGVIYPVRVAKGADLSRFRQITDSDSVTITVTNRGNDNTTKYEGKEALFESADYSYYVLSEVPDYYKELTIEEDGTLSFGAVQAEKESIESGVSATLMTESSYGDYQISFKGLPSVVSDASEVYGVVLHTEQGEDYGLRHLENIWLKTNLAWSAGIVTTTHGNTLAPEHYKSMMGKNITGFTYYTSNGVQEITLDEDLYVPYKFNYAEFGVANAAAESGKTEMTGLEAIPSDYEAEFTLAGPDGKEADGFTIADGSITWNGKADAGTYTLTAKDKTGKYADISATFVLSTESVPAQATATADGVWSLKTAEDATEEEFHSYLSSITAVKVNGTTYAASGRGAVKIIDPNTGIIDVDAKKEETAIFVKGEKYEIEVIATGYAKNLAFEMVAGEAPKPEGIAVEGTVSKETTGYYVNKSYQAKLLVTVNADGTVLSVRDNGTEPGANEDWWNDAMEIFGDLIGKNKNQIDAVDSISGATASSGVIKNIVKSVLPDVAEAKPQAPKLTAADFRTKLLYAATGEAELAVEASDGAVVKYTVDGSDPSEHGIIAENGVITVLPENNEDAQITVKAVAVKNGVASEITEKELQFLEIPKAQSGLKVYEGSSTVNTPSGAPYTAKLKVTVSDGKIVKVEDNGTKTTDIRDEAFWKPYLFSENEEGISAKFAGKDLAELLDAKTVPNSRADLRVDAITGATVSSDAAKYAVIDAMRSDAIDESDESVMAPEVSPAWGSLVARVSNGISLAVSSAENTTVYYTTDGSDPTQEDETISYGRATIYANNNKSGKVKVKFAAFDEDGKRSKIVSVWCVFTDELPEVLYKTGNYEGSAGTVEAEVTVNSGYGSRPIISNIVLDEKSEEKFANFLPELIAEITYRQSTKIKPLTAYDADMQQEVLDAVEAALKKALSGEVMVSMKPDKQIYGSYYGTYDFEEAPEVTLSCGVKGAEIYYYVTDDFTTENPDVATWTLYEGSFTPEFTKEKGGSLYIQIASTRDGGENWLDTKQISITYKEKANENAVMIGDTGYTSLTKALAEVQDGDVIVLNEDVSLEGTVTMPEASFEITSADGECYKVESQKPLELNGSLEISNVDWRADTYLNGYDFTAGEGVAQDTWRFSYTKLYAGSKKDRVEANPTITISSGQFEIYGCAQNAELDGDVTISVDGTAMVKITGAASGSELNGSIDVTVNGEDGAMLASFIGRQSSAKVSGELTLTLEGAVQFYAWGGRYEAIEYSSDDVWGTLDLTNAAIAKDDADRFEGFETILGAEEDDDEITDETLESKEEAKKVQTDLEESEKTEKKEETVDKADSDKNDDKAEFDEIVDEDEKSEDDAEESEGEKSEETEEKPEEEPTKDDAEESEKDPSEEDLEESEESKSEDDAEESEKEDTEELEEKKSEESSSEVLDETVTVEA